MENMVEEKNRSDRGENPVSQQVDNFSNEPYPTATNGARCQRLEPPVFMQAPKSTFTSMSKAQVKRIN